MMFDVKIKLDWENVEKYRGKHDILKEFFVDKDNKSYAMVGNEKYVITRDFNKNTNSVTFSVFGRPGYIWQTNKYLKENGEMTEYFADKNK